MGWDGQACFQEYVDGHWIPSETADIQALTYAARNALDAPFIQDASTNDNADSKSGSFLWADFVAASRSNDDLGSYRSETEALAELAARGSQPLAKALSDMSRTFRVFVDVSH